MIVKSLLSSVSASSLCIRGGREEKSTEDSKCFIVFKHICESGWTEPVQ